VLNTEMMAVAKASEILGADQSRMLDPAAEPDTSVEPRFLYNCPSKSNAALKHYPCFLRVHRNRTSLASNSNPPIERLAERRRLSGEMVSQPVVAARVPQVFGDETVTTLGTAPEWLLRTGHGSSRLIVDLLGHESY
jgi:hypothetical protein